MPDYEKVHRDYQAKRVTLNQLWIEYCEACQKSGVLPYQLTQFKKYYREYIAVDRQNYSVPYEYIRQKVDVRITRSTIEAFFNGVRICLHPRLYGRANQ